MSNQYTQVTLLLNRKEMDALCNSAHNALRRPKDQARFILRNALGLREQGGEHFPPLTTGQKITANAVKVAESQSSLAVR